MAEIKELVQVGKRQERCEVEELNALLRRWRKSARKVEEGSTKAKYYAGAACWARLRSLKAKRSCCGKSSAKMCGRCPRRFVNAQVLADQALAPVESFDSESAA